MRAREFIINIPISFKLHDNGVEISIKNMPEPSSMGQQLTNVSSDMSIDSDCEDGGTFVPPLQQKLELMKQAAGKQSSVIDQIVADDDTELS